MSETEIFVSFTSDDCKHIFPLNNGYDFYFKLDRRMHLDTGRWKVLLVSFHNDKMKYAEDRVILCMDGLIHSIVGQNRYLPCLERYPKEGGVSHLPIPFRVSRDYFEVLYIYLDGEESLLNTYKDQRSTVQLIFKREHCV